VEDHLASDKKTRFAKMADATKNSKFNGLSAMEDLILRFMIRTLFASFGAVIVICFIFSLQIPLFFGWLGFLLTLLRIWADPPFFRVCLSTVPIIFILCWIGGSGLSAEG
jgi:hypothetical protein